MLDWLIIGGGVHGTVVSHYLTQAQRVTRERIRVLDPHPRALARWDRWTSNTATDYLRSPDEHHMDVAPEALARFAATAAGRAAGGVSPDGRRPALGLFRAHAAELERLHRLDALRVQGSATGFAPNAAGEGWTVETTNGPLRARRVVLAIGPDDRVPWPSWAEALRERGAPIDHVLDERFVRAEIGRDEHVVVIGGGISAGQLAIGLAARPGQVTLITRHAPRVHTLDADSPWFARAGVLEFARAVDPRVRRNLLGLGRRRGSMPKDTAHRLGLAIREGRVALRYGEVARTTMLEGVLRVETGEHAVTCDRIVLATGFSPRRPGGSWLARAIASEGLPIAPCGYPVASAQLAWRPGLHVTGPLAELQLGAAARSIAGARRAAEILATLD